MKSVYLALFRLPVDGCELSRLTALCERHGLQLGTQWGQARYYLESAEQVTPFAEAGIWLTTAELEGELRRGQMGLQTSLSLGTLSLVGNIGFISYRGEKLLAIELEHDVLAALADLLADGSVPGDRGDPSPPVRTDLLEHETRYVDRFLVEVAQTVGSRSFVLGWEVALDVLGDLLLGVLRDEQGAELCTGSELRLLTVAEQYANQLRDLEPVTELREWKGMQYRASWFPGVSEPEM